jgi:small-conductance mechanosensitive channel
MEQFFSQWGPTSITFWVRALWALAVFIGSVSVAQLGRRGIQRSLQRAGAPPNAILFFGRVVQLILLALGLLFALAVLGVELSALAAIFGVLTVAVTLSLQDILRSAIAGWYLLIERPFQVGDTVEVDGKEGVIEDVGMRTTILRNADGARVIVPNTVMFTSVVTQKKMAQE